MAATGCFLVFAGALAIALSCCALPAPAAGMSTPSASSASSSLDCATVTSLLAGCAAFVRRGPGAAPLPAPGTPCCEGVTGLYAVAADSADNWRSVCRCMAGLVRQYWSNATAICCRASAACRPCPPLMPSPTAQASLDDMRRHGRANQQC